MRTSQKLLLALALALVLAAGGYAVWLLEPWNPITYENYERITDGMMLAAVEAILGGPGQKKMDGPDCQNVRHWRGGGNILWVSFYPDTSPVRPGRVSDKGFHPFTPEIGPPPKDLPLRLKIRWWLNNRLGW